MIRLEGVTKIYKTNGHSKCVLDNVSCEFPRGLSIGILGLNGAGKSTLMRLMDGTETPTLGTVRRSGRISRLGLSGGFHKSLTGAENVRFVSRIYGENPKLVLAYVENFAELGEDLHMPVRTYSAGMRARLRLGLSLAMKFDTYLVDESTSAGDERFQERCRYEMKEKLSTSDVIMVSHSASTLNKYCTHAAILNNHKLSEVYEMEEAMVRYRRIVGVGN